MIDLTKTYDAIVVGTGAAGGFAAKELSEGGLEILVLEAGPRLDPASHFKTHTWPYDRHRRNRRQSLDFATCIEAPGTHTMGLGLAEMLRCCWDKIRWMWKPIRRDSMWARQ